MYCASFIWEPGIYDADFHRLNDVIGALAQSLPGYLGVDAWVSPDGSRRCANYGTVA